MDGTSAPALPPNIKRHKFTAADVQAMIEAGVIREGDHHIELIAGELIDMPPQGPAHWSYTHLLTTWFYRSLPPEFAVASQGPFRLGSEYEPEPEIFVFPAGLDINKVRGADAALVVEVALSSLAYDLTTKAAVYAVHGVKEYWVVDVEGRRTLVHRRKPGGYGAPEAVPFEQPLQAPGGQELTISQVVRLDG